MSYCAAEDVQEEFVDLVVSEGAKITPSLLARWIEEADAEIDSAIAQLYSVPVNVSSAVKSAPLLRKIAIGLVSSQVKCKLKTDAPTSSEPDREKQYEKDPATAARKLLAQIADKTIVLTDASPASTLSGVASGNVVNGVTPVWKKDSDQW